MYYFFARISQFAFIVIAALFLLSIVMRNFWCRYLCPYGALLGILSLISPHKIKRNASSCIDCGRCSKVCPSNIQVDRLKTVVSDECSTCLACVDSCPVADTLALRPIVSARRIPKKVVAAVIVLLFVAITGGAMIAGYWQNDITPEQYLHHQKYLQSYGHPTGANDIEALNRKATAPPRPGAAGDKTDQTGR
jgi:ferredoxin